MFYANPSAGARATFFNLVQHVSCHECLPGRLQVVLLPDISSSSTPSLQPSLVHKEALLDLHRHSLPGTEYSDPVIQVDYLKLPGTFDGERDIETQQMDHPRVYASLDSLWANGAGVLSAVMSCAAVQQPGVNKAWQPGACRMLPIMVSKNVLWRDLIGVCQKQQCLLR
jgi:hypothetical protein